MPKHVSTLRSLLALGLSFGGLSFFARAGHGQAASQSASIGLSARDSAEVVLGAALAERFDRDRGVTPTPQSMRIEAYLQHVADSLGRFTRRKLPWRIHYDPDPAIRSGFALPGGHIVIWGGVIAYMNTEDELAAIISHEMMHVDDGQVTRRIDSLVTTKHRRVSSADDWSWDEFGATYGQRLESLCDYDGAKVMVRAGYSPLGMKMLLQSFVALAEAHRPAAGVKPPNAAFLQPIRDRVAQVDREIIEQHWQGLTTTHVLRMPQ